MTARKCPFCQREFANARGVNIHLRSCKADTATATPVVNLDDVVDELVGRPPEPVAEVEPEPDGPIPVRCGGKCKARHAHPDDCPVFAHSGCGFAACVGAMSEAEVAGGFYSPDVVDAWKIHRAMNGDR